MVRLAAHGLSMDLPPGWDGRISRRPAQDDGSITNPVLHAGNFALPERRGDFGSGAVEIMRPTNVLVILFEYSPERSGAALFRPQGLPRALAADEFSPRHMQRAIRGQAGVQRFFNEQGRAFCLYVVLGSWQGRLALVPLVNDALTRISIEPRPDDGRS